MLSMLAVLGGADCERIRSDWLAQPASALSSLAYLAVGIWLLRRPTAVAAGVHRSVLLPAGSALAAVGIGSFAYHGPQPEWAKAAHDASIIGLALVIIGHHIWVLARFRKSRAAALRCVWTKTALWFAPALAAYWAGRTGSSLCRPASAWQYHAAWHALSAFDLGVAAKSLAVGGTRRVEAGDR